MPDLVSRCAPVIAFLGLCLCVGGRAAEPTKPEAGPMWDTKALFQPPKAVPAEGFQAEGMRAVFYEGLPYRGRPTRVFAWLGIPKAEPGKKLPGMVLVPGGGGTAFANWVKLWNDRGYAAIAMDTCGCVPRGSYGNWQRHEAGGPPGWGGWKQMDEPREDQWTYHAVAEAILAHSLLRAQPEVDPDRIGLTGISWGGYLACILAGVDHRFKLAVPVYGCGFTNEHGFAGNVAALGKERGDRWMRWWDPSAYLKDAPMPIAWVTGSNDFAYTFNALQKSYRLPRGPRTLCIRLRMPHGHGPAGEAPKEIQAFADSMLKGGDPLAKITGQGREGNQVWATYESKRAIVKAELNITRDMGRWQDRTWEALPAQLAAPGKATATLPDGVTVYYLNLLDDRDCVVSTEHVEQAGPKERAAGKVPAPADWPGWRGDGSGISPETNLPVRWDAETNIAWRTALPGRGNSSPIVWRGRIFLTAWDDDGRKRSVLCLDARDGKILWQAEMAAPRVEKTNPKNGYASSTPATDGQRVYAFFDSPGLVALDFEGKVLWTRDLGPFKTDWGIASSPILYRDLVIQCCDFDGGGFLVALDAATGEERWRAKRPDPRQYATPLLLTHNGKPQIAVNGMTVIAYEPESGQELWRCRGMNQLCAPSAVYADGLVYAASGRNGPAMAIDPGGQGDVTETHVRWYLSSGGPYVISPIVHPCLVLPGDNGALRVVDARGTVVLTESLRGHFSSSPVAADGRLYWANEKGDTYVIDVSAVAAAKPSIKVVAVNPLGEKVLASPAIAGGRLFIRTAEHLYCVAGAGEPKVAAAAGAQRGTLAELEKRYESHPAPEGDDVAVRIEVVEALGKLKDSEAIALLRRAAQEDAHWDVSEAAAKALGAYGAEAAPALLPMFADHRGYLKVIAAEHLGRAKVAGAVPTLVKAAKDREAAVRIAALRALAQIAAANEAEVKPGLAALVAALPDKDGVVKQAAIEALAGLADKVGEERQTVVKAIQECAADRNPLVAKAAREALRNSYKAQPPSDR